jgi:hypothetical protein
MLGIHLKTRKLNPPNYHRNRGKLSLERKAKRLSGSSSTVEIAIKIPTGFAASIIFYRERQDAPVHAIAAEVWQTDKGKVVRSFRGVESG